MVALEAKHCTCLFPPYLLSACCLVSFYIGFMEKGSLHQMKLHYNMDQFSNSIHLYHHSHEKRQRCRFFHFSIMFSEKFVNYEVKMKSFIMKG